MIEDEGKSVLNTQEYSTSEMKSSKLNNQLLASHALKLPLYYILWL